MPEITYPIAETFLSPQGEGQWVGHLMQFIRFAGCSVGIPFTPAARNEWIAVHNETPAPYQERCCSGMGEPFLCDTNYRMKERMTIPQLFSTIPTKVSRICFTGGEPLIHDLVPLISKIISYSPLNGALDVSYRTIHIETSGTILFDDVMKGGEGVYDENDIWWTVAPKIGYLPACVEQADEIKILVGPIFSETDFLFRFEHVLDKTTLLPINGEHSLNEKNMNHCLELQLKHPQLRVGTQSHKIWGCR